MYSTLLKKTTNRGHWIMAVVLITSITTQISSQSSNSSKDFTIVLDAGHGGKDKGCSGVGYQEKDIALNLTLKIGDELGRANNNLNVIFTRTADEFVTLSSRASLANQLRADLFISVHANAYSTADIRGTETYVLGANENDVLSKRENASLLLESDISIEEYKKLYDSPEGTILLSSITNNYLDSSIDLASRIEKNLSYISDHKSLGVKQAPFAVLRETMMPSILFEAGYLTNKADLINLQNEDYLKVMAKKIAKAIIEYCYENGTRNEAPLEEVVKPQVIPTKKESTPSYHKTKTEAIVEKYKPSNKATQKGSIKEVEKVKEVKKPSKTTATSKYSLQVATSYSPDLKINTNQISSDKKIIKVSEKELYIYYLGYYDNLQSANEDRLKMMNLGYKGTFITKAVLPPTKEKIHSIILSPNQMKKTNIISY